jgi:branched-chain amino acid transport system permease protein
MAPNIILEAVMQTAVAGLMAGILYGLMASGVGLIFGVMRVVNFAQGEFLMLGMYGAVFAAALIAPLGLFGVTLGAYIGVLLTGPVIFILGAIIHRVVLSRSTGLRAAGTDSGGHYTQMILTLGVSLIFQSVALAWFGAVPRQNRTPISDQAWTFQPFPGIDAEVFVNQGHAVSCLVALVLVAVIYQVFSRTSVGKSLRAAADNPVAATYVGIRVDRAHRFAFAFGVAITAVAGGLVSIYYPFQPYVGVQFLIIMYAAVVLGGLGSVLGAFWGGLIIGFVQQVSALFLPLELQSAAIFVVLVATLFFKPDGIFGKNVDRV